MSSREGSSPQGIIKGNINVFLGADFQRKMKIPFRIVLNIELTKAVRRGMCELLVAAQEMAGNGKHKEKDCAVAPLISGIFARTGRHSSHQPW